MTITSLRKLAEELGANHGVLSRLRRNPDWPVSPTPPWDSDRDVPAIRQWMTQRSESRFVPTAAAAQAGGFGQNLSPQQVAQIKLYMAREREITLRTEIRRGEYVRRDEVQERSSRAILEVKAGLLCLERRCSMFLNEEQRRKIHKECIALLDGFANNYPYAAEEAKRAATIERLEEVDETNCESRRLSAEEPGGGNDEALR